LNETFAGVARSEIAASKHTLKMFLTQFMCINCKKES
jgi:hypothetical protein